jgi:hypothetical protein
MVEEFMNVPDKQWVILYLPFGIEFDQLFCVCFQKRQIMR